MVAPCHPALRSGSGYLIREWYSAVKLFTRLTSTVCNSVLLAFRASF
jgi:hypothetical protein